MPLRRQQRPGSGRDQDGRTLRDRGGILMIRRGAGTWGHPGVPRGSTATLGPDPNGRAG